MSEVESRYREYALVYGDGEIEGPWEDFEEVEGWRTTARRCIADGTWNAGDYEPMTIVTRERVVTISDWAELLDPTTPPDPNQPVPHAGDDEGRAL